MFTIWGRGDLVASYFPLLRLFSLRFRAVNVEYGAMATVERYPQDSSVCLSTCVKK